MIDKAAGSSDGANLVRVAEEKERKSSLGSCISPKSSSSSSSSDDDPDDLHDSDDDDMEVY